MSKVHLFFTFSVAMFIVSNTVIAHRSPVLTQEQIQNALQQQASANQTIYDNREQ